MVCPFWGGVYRNGHGEGWKMSFFIGGVLNRCPLWWFCSELLVSKCWLQPFLLQSAVSDRIRSTVLWRRRTRTQLVMFQWSCLPPFFVTRLPFCQDRYSSVTSWEGRSSRLGSPCWKQLAPKVSVILSTSLKEVFGRVKGDSGVISDNHRCRLWGQPWYLKNAYDFISYCHPLAPQYFGWSLQCFW